MGPKLSTEGKIFCTVVITKILAQQKNPPLVVNLTIWINLSI